ncbi:MAG: MarR family winged helix-turn-helix transcriptional regulator [Aristaeellaceae bacterium]
MAKRWTADTALVSSLATNLVEALPLFPKRMIRMDAIVRAYGMPSSHIQILVMIRNGPASIGELSSKLCIAKPNITPLVDSLRDQGLVERVRDENDRRIVNVRMLPAGQEKLNEIEQAIATQVAQWPGEFSRSEMKELNNALASIIRIVQGFGGGDA